MIGTGTTLCWPTSTPSTPSTARCLTACTIQLRPEDATTIPDDELRDLIRAALDD